MDPKHHILRVASRAGCARDRLMVIVLVAGGCTGEELRHLTVLDALKLVHHPRQGAPPTPLKRSDEVECWRVM